MSETKAFLKREGKSKSDADARHAALFLVSGSRCKLFQEEYIGFDSSAVDEETGEGEAKVFLRKGIPEEYAVDLVPGDGGSGLGPEATLQSFEVAHGMDLPKSLLSVARFFQPTPLAMVSTRDSRGADSPPRAISTPASTSAPSSFLFLLLLCQLGLHLLSSS